MWMGLSVSLCLLLLETWKIRTGYACALSRRRSSAGPAMVSRTRRRPCSPSHMAQGRQLDRAAVNLHEGLKMHVSNHGLFPGAPLWRPRGRCFVERIHIEDVVCLNEDLHLLSYPHTPDPASICQQDGHHDVRPRPRPANHRYSRPRFVCAAQEQAHAWRHRRGHSGGICPHAAPMARLLLASDPLLPVRYRSDSHRSQSQGTPHPIFDRRIWWRGCKDERSSLRQLGVCLRAYTTAHLLAARLPSRSKPPPELDRG